MGKLEIDTAVATNRPWTGSSSGQRNAHTALKTPSTKYFSQCGSSIKSWYNPHRRHWGVIPRSGRQVWYSVINCPARRRGRPPKVPKAIKREYRRFQILISQWVFLRRRKRGKGLSEDDADRLRTTLKTDRDAVREEQMSPKEFKSTWTERLETAGRAARLAKSGAPG